MIWKIIYHFWRFSFHLFNRLQRGSFWGRFDFRKVLYQASMTRTRALKCLDPRIYISYEIIFPVSQTLRHFDPLNPFSYNDAVNVERTNSLALNYDFDILAFSFLGNAEVFQCMDFHLVLTTYWNIFKHRRKWWYFPSIQYLHLTF